MRIPLSLVYSKSESISDPWLLVTPNASGALKIRTNMAKLSGALTRGLGDGVERTLEHKEKALYSLITVPQGKEALALLIIVKHLYPGE